MASEYFGGGALVVAHDSTAAVENSTFSKNLAGQASAVEADGLVAISSSTLAENTASGGNSAALQILSNGAGQQTTIKNTVFSANVGEAGNCQFGGALVTLLGVNLSSDANCGGFTLNNTDARLSPLANNGGPTKTYAVQPGSPAVDRALDCSDANGQALPFDQRGHTRPQGAACDIGAFELDDRIFADGFGS
jgi:hypothetical protein